MCTCVECYVTEKEYYVMYLWVYLCLVVSMFKTVCVYLMLPYVKRDELCKCAGCFMQTCQSKQHRQIHIDTHTHTHTLEGTSCVGGPWLGTRGGGENNPISLARGGILSSEACDTYLLCQIIPLFTLHDRKLGISCMRYLAGGRCVRLQE